MLVLKCRWILFGDIMSYAIMTFAFFFAFWDKWYQIIGKIKKKLQYSMSQCYTVEFTVNTYLSMGNLPNK